MTEYYLSRIFKTYNTHFPDDIEFSSKVKTMIDYKFNQRTKKYFRIQFGLYIILFLIPHSIQLFGGLSGDPARRCLVIAMLGQLLLLMDEFIQMKVIGKDYWNDNWNLFDLS